MRIKKEESIAVIIDIQEKIFFHINNHEMLVQSISILVQGLQELAIPILVTQQYTKGLGSTISVIKDLLTSYKPIEKTSFSCVDEVKFSEELSLSGKRNVIICGIESHVCVLQTCIDLVNNGYQPIIVEDCVSSRNVKDKKIAIERMRNEGAIVTSYESLLFELLQFSNSPHFKRISNLVK